MRRIFLIGGGAAALASALACAFLITPDRSRAFLDARYLRGPGDLIEVSGVRLHVRDEGRRDGPALILIHGFGSSLQTWDGWIPGLAADHRLIRLDLPGSGLSGPDPRGDYSDARSVRVLLDLMDRLKVGRATFIGNSIGGRIAWTLAAAHPERVSSLVLISPDGFASPGFAYGARARVSPLLEIMRLVLPKALVRSSLEPAYGDPRRLTDETVTRYWDLMRAPGVRPAMILRLRTTVLQDPGPILARIRAPVLILWGEHDGMIPFSNAEDYVKALPNARLAPLSGLGHVPQEEDPARSLGPVRAFLRNVGG